MKEQRRLSSMLVGSMLIFGTLGVFVYYIPLSSAALASARAVVGTAFLAAVLAAGRKKVDWGAMRRQLPLLLMSGAAVGFNWVLLFEAYRYTTVAVATLCYYMAPVFVVLLSPLVLKERLTLPKAVTAVCAVAGAAMISGASGGGSLRGIACGLAAAGLYASIIFMNKFIKGVPPLETTFVQLAASAAVVLPYTALTGGFPDSSPGAVPILLTLLVGVLHTGVAYILFFSAVGKLPAQMSALLGYIDPLAAILLSALVLGQPMTWLQAAGAALILGSTLAGETLPAAAPRSADR